MQTHDWIELFRLIPADQHNTLVLTTVSGIDLNLEIVLRMESNYLVFRGRVSGNTDEGRVFFLPYRQIDFLQINRQVKEVEVRQMFGEPVEVPASEAAMAEALPASASPPGSTPDAPKASQVPAAVAGPFRSSAQGGVGRLSSAPSASPSTPTLVGRAAGTPDAARASSGAGDGGTSGTEEPAPPRNSILERLRAQRNSILPPKPPGR